MDSLFENLKEVLFSVDPASGRFREISSGVTPLLGLDPGDLKERGREGWELICPPELRGKRELRAEDFPPGASEYEYEVLRTDGEALWVKATLKPVFSPQGEVVGLEGLLSDLTARKTVEEELSARNLELLTLNQISELTLVSPDLASALPQLLTWIVEATGFPMAFLERLDKKRDHLVLLGHVGMSDFEEDVVEIPLHQSLGALAVERRQPLAVEDARTHPRFRSDFLRRQKLRSCVAFPLMASGNVLGVLNLADREVREIPLRLLGWGDSLANLLASFMERIEAESALREGEQEARKLAEELRQANEELEAFAYSVSHDLRAPLRTMQGFAHALLREHGNSLHPQARDFVRRIVASGTQMEGLIRDLLAYSRMSFEEMELQEVDLDQALADALDQVRAYVTERGAEVTVPKSLPSVRAHHTTLVQVLANLISNGVKFVPDERTPEVILSWEEMEEEQAIRLTVQDNGSGIPPGQEERIFRVFERLEGEVDREGTGIGLAIVRRGMDRIGGRVGVSSREGEGSRFWVEVPKSQPRRWRPWGGRRGTRG